MIFFEPGALRQTASRLAALRPGRLMIVFASAGILAACASAPPATFDLDAAPTGFSAKQARRAQIAIAAPSALPPVDSNRIVVRVGEDQIALLAGAAWSNQLPALLQAKLIASFQNASLIRAVVSPGMPADYELRSQIRSFEYVAGRGAVFVEISAQIVGGAGRIVAGKIFSATAPAPANDGATVVAALNAATADVMRQIVRWTAPQI
ncbi:protein of unknown function DUF330 [Methylocella silvestris BL2]|uniref:ABC-type transport auxiliary lipoprotein component domain-containing protein n=1 Tax=Methylocella silvestris (strain DSM 15510 / CIP 108128 / LMG 27833 / NCIMB 13906 / BL2) TaxID=395965 RepID=B8ET80_METSB|nr:ABC-type transport auxiliary lipoprotein family protein [Methylocella silvestris]ACK51722.1 protein of unknown function DUF330 [Methylocella silvestris BL2]